MTIIDITKQCTGDKYTPQYTVIEEQINKIANFSAADIAEVIRKTLTPYQASTYLPEEDTPVTGYTFVADEFTKLVVPTSVAGIPHGFDMYATPQGTSIRFIGEGINAIPVTKWFQMEVHAALGSANQKTTFILGGATRPYTETVWANVTKVPGIFTKQEQPNNDTNGISIVAPHFQLTTGDTLEIFGISSLDINTLSFEAFSFKIKEL